MIKSTAIKLWKRVAWLLAAFALVAAAPAQEGAITIPWWVWLVVISLVLLVMFIFVLVFAYSQARNDEEEGG